MALRPKSLEHADRLLARSVFWLVLALATTLFGGPPGDSDREGELIYQATRALALGDGLRLSDEVPEGAALLEQGYGVRLVPGGGIAHVEPLLAATGVPFYLLGSQLAGLLPGIERTHASTSPGFAAGRSEYWSHVFVALRGPLFIALAAWMTCMTALRLGVRRATAWFGSLALAVTTHLLSDAAAFSAQAQVAAGASASLYALVLVRDRFYRLSAPGVWHWLLLGSLLGATAATDPTFAPAGLLLVISAVRMSVRGRQRLWSMPLLKGGAGAKRSLVDMAWFGAPMLVMLAIWTWGSFEREGGLVLSAFPTVVPLAQWPGEFAGLLLSPGKGLVWLAPLMFPLAFIGYTRLSKEPRLLTFTAWAPLAVLATTAATGIWADLDRFGPAGSAAAVVLAWPAVLVGYDLVRLRMSLRYAAFVLAALGLLANLGGVLVARGTWRGLVVAAATDLYPDGPLPPSHAFDRRVALDWRTAAPWLDWRIVRHRAAAAQGDFPADLFPSHRLLFFEGGGPYGGQAPRERNFLHLAWVDFEERLDGRMWPVFLFLVAALGSGIVLGVKGLDPTRP